MIDLSNKETINLLNNLDIVLENELNNNNLLKVIKMVNKYSVSNLHLSRVEQYINSLSK